MRKATMVTLLASILVLIMQCGENEPLHNFNGRMEIVSDSITREYPFAPYIFRMRTDSIKWVHEFPSQGPRSVSIILSGQIQTDSADIDIGIGQNHLDLEVETHTDSVPGIVRLAFDSVGGFLDTVPIAASPLSVILPQSSRLFVKIGDYTLDTIRLVNPHAAGGQQ